MRPLTELSVAPEALIHQVPVPRATIGIIAGHADGKVDLDLTHLPGQVEADHLAVPAWHSFLMNRADVQCAVANFLRDGKFTATD